MHRGSAELERTSVSPQEAHAMMLDALVAGEGFARVATIATECVGAPVGILVPRPGSDGAGGTPAERYVADLVAGRSAVPPGEIAELVPIVSDSRPLGAVVMLAPGRPEADEYLEAAAAVALAGIAVLNAREEAAPSASLLEALLSGEALGAEEARRRAGCDLSGGTVAICADPGEGHLSHLVATIVAECPEALVERARGRVWALVPGERAVAERLLDLLAGRSLAAASSLYLDPGDLGAALAEAETMLELARAGGHESAEGPVWVGLRLLSKAFRAVPAEVERFAEETVGELIRHDRTQGSELEATFWAFQASNCNMNETAKRIFTHRHTVANRLTRIEQLTGLDPSLSEGRELLSLGLKAHCVATIGTPLRS